jgi:hypothetical protein
MEMAVRGRFSLRKVQPVALILSVTTQDDSRFEAGISSGVWEAANFSNSALKQAGDAVTWPFQWFGA